ncbi:MAG: M4 family metallopeptidase, partial [Bacteroidales bacterium]|nr:M4 family metallopeptidase [Bacteroidales bacterium]
MKSNQRKFAVLILMAFAFNAALAQLQSVAQSQHPKIVKGSFGFNVSQNKISKENFASKKLNEYFSLNEKHSFKLLLQTPAGESPTGKTSTSKTLAGKTTYEDSKQETPDKLETPDELGFTHSNYQQLYNGYPIYGQLVMLHCKDGIVRSINGQIAEFDTLDLQINISDTRAVSIAKAYLNVTELAKEYPVETLITKIPCSTEPQYRLTKKVHMESHSPFLMYDVFVDAKTGDVLNKISLFAGAAAGTAKTLYNGIQNITCSLDSGVYYLIDEERKIATADATAEPKYYQSNSSTWKGVPLLKSIKISSISEDWWHTFIIDESPDLYIIIKDGSGKVVHTTTNYSDVFPPLTFSNINLLITNPPYKLELWDYDPAGGDDYAGSYTFSGYVGTYNLSGNSNFTAGYSAVDSGHAAYDVHWGIEKTYDFYKNTFNRNSYDGNGGAILSLVNPVYANGSNGFPNNAAAQLVEPYSMMFGMGDGKICNPVVGLDVAAHEFSHLVIANNGVGGLIYQGESGALNESFADIFGTCVEFYSKPAYANWDIGEDVIIKYSNLRSVSNPNNSKGNTQQPDTYKG